MATGDVAKSAFKGNQPYQIRARRAIPILVRQAKASEPIRYGELAQELNMSNPRNLNFVLGAVGRALQDLEADWNSRFPKLTALVINKYTGEPSDGILEFLDDPEIYRSASQEVRRRMIDQLLVEVYAFPRWDQLLLHWGLQPLPGVGPTPVPIRGSVPEGEEHRRLKEYVAAHPEAVGLRRSDRPGTLEALLPSGDEVDVLFSAKSGLTGIEIKAHTASDPEIARGMYQCVKYQAVLRAQQKVDQVPADARAWLVLGRTLPDTLIPLRNTLGIHLVEVRLP
jgi:hypothetical protein